MRAVHLATALVLILTPQAALAEQGDGRPRVAKSLQAAGDPLAANQEAARAFNRGDLTAAEAGFLRAISLYEQAQGPGAEAVGVGWVNLAEVYRVTGRFDEAQAAMARARGIFAAISPTHRYLAVVENNMAALARASGDTAASEAGYRRTLESMEAAFGPDHPNTAVALGNLAAALLAQDRAAEAAPLLRRADAIEARLYASDAPERAATLSGLGQAEIALGRYEAAIPHLQAAITAYARSTDINPSLLAGIRTHLGHALRAAGRPQEARPVLVQALEEAERAHGASALETAAPLANLAGVFFDEAQYDAAAPLLRRAQAILAAHPDADPALASTVNNNYANILRGQGYLDQAERHYRLALAADEARGARASELAVTHENLSGVLRAQGRFGESVGHQALAVTLYRLAYGARHPQTARALGNAGITLGLTGDHEGAESFFAEAVGMLSQMLPQAHPDVMVARINLAWLYLRHMGRPAEALAQYRAATAGIIDHAFDAGRAREGAGGEELRRRGEIFVLRVDAAWAAAHPG